MIRELEEIEIELISSKAKLMERMKEFRRI